MGSAKQKTVVSADAVHVTEVRALVAEGRYRTLSEFVREAMDEKLQRVRCERLAEDVARYCAEERGEDDGDLIAHQAFDEPGD